MLLTNQKIVILNNEITISNMQASCQKKIFTKYFES